MERLPFVLPVGENSVELGLSRSDSEEDDGLGVKGSAAGFSLIADETKS